MLEHDRPDHRASTGLEALDDVLGGLYWGDNVVWQHDGVSVTPFYSAIASLSDVFETRTLVSVGEAPEGFDMSGLSLLAAGAGSGLPQPADLLNAVHLASRPQGRHLFLFDSLNSMIRVWGARSTRGFFARCCPMLLEMGTIAYWTMDLRQTPAIVRDAVEAVTQCVLRVDERSIRIAKAEGRADGVRGSVLYRREEDGVPALSRADLVGRVAASLRAVRRSRGLTQQDLARLAGVTASAISQAERAERSLSLATMARLSAATGLTIDDLLRGEGPETYRIGRLTDDPDQGLEHITTLIGDMSADLRVDLIHLDAHQATRLTEAQRGVEVIAVASGLIQVQIAKQTPTVRQGEVLVANSQRIQGARNLAPAPAMLFWIVVAPPSAR